MNERDVMLRGYMEGFKSVLREKVAQYGGYPQSALQGLPPDLIEALQVPVQEEVQEQQMPEYSPEQQALMQYYEMLMQQPQQQQYPYGQQQYYGGGY